MDDIGQVLKKQKNWTSPRIYGIQNYWWKKLSKTTCGKAEPGIHCVKQCKHESKI